MFKDKYVFAQLVQFLDRNKFNRLSAKYQGDRYVKSFTCWNQLLVMMFGQLSKSESLRDLIIALEVHWSKLYHLGMGKSVTRSNLAKANEGRDYRIFEEYAYHLVAAARSKSTEKMFGFTGHVYAFDSTTIDLCLEVSMAMFVSIRAESKYIRCMILNPKSQLSFISRWRQPVI